MNSSLPLNAPVDMVMPPTAQLWMNVLNWGLAVVLLGFALDYWRRRGSTVGVWLLLGGALTTLNEPIVDVLGKCWFPAFGAWVAFKAWGFSTPLYMIAVYSWYVGGQAFLSYRRFRTGITRRGVFQLFGTFAAVNMLLEIPGLNTAIPMYSYYGHQPFVFLGFPIWWMFCNGMMPLVIAAVVLKGDALLQGVRRPLIVPLVWMSACMTNALIAPPTWLALNLEGGTPLLTHAAAVVSLGMSLMVCYAVASVVAIDPPESPFGANEPRHEQNGRLAAGVP